MDHVAKGHSTQVKISVLSNQYITSTFPSACCLLLGSCLRSPVCCLHCDLPGVRQLMAACRHGVQHHCALLGSLPAAPSLGCSAANCMQIVERGCALLGYVPIAGTAMLVLATRVRPAATLPGGHVVRLVVEHKWLQLPLQASPPAALPHSDILMSLPNCMSCTIQSEGSVSPQLDGLQDVVYSWGSPCQQPDGDIAASWSWHIGQDGWHCAAATQPGTLESPAWRQARRTGTI